ncbi:hypothetical protein J26TS2_30100 [Shouchella clausii]|nr:hypothetical protein J26TS2_30100 [Shouchella clausii]
MYTFYPEVTLLLDKDLNQKERMFYLKDSWLVPKIGPRPPFYAYPRYGPSYPII